MLDTLLRETVCDKKKKIKIFVYNFFFLFKFFYSACAYSKESQWNHETER